MPRLNYDSQEWAKRQTIDEWTEANVTGVPVEPKALRQPTPNHDTPDIQLFRYLTHRTVQNKKLGKSFLVMCFENTATGEEAFLMCNVDTLKQRGPDKGHTHPLGEKGQFLPLPRSKFRKFWTSAVGKPPRRWAAVHKELHSQLAILRFSGETELSAWPDGKLYCKLKNVKKRNSVGTKMEQPRNNMETII